MKKSINIKNSQALKLLLENPHELSGVIKIAFHANAKGLTDISDLNLNKGVILNLKSWGIITEQTGMYAIQNELIPQATKQKPSRNKLLSEIQDYEVKEDEKEPLKIALAFQKLFYENLKALNVPTIHVENAKFEAWTDPIRLMILNKEATTDQLREVWQYLQHHSFWSANCQSTVKLRKQFQTIYSQLKNEKRNETRTKQSKSKLSTDFVQGLFSSLQSTENND